MKCLQDEDDFGELKQCPLANQLCAKGKMDFEGKPVMLRRCQIATGKAGKCEEIKIRGKTTNIC